MSATLVASGGTAPYRFELAAGQWPAGLAMDSSGHLSGRARAAGVTGLTVRVTDADANTLDVPIRLQVAARPDPTADAGVIGLQVAQAEALKRFGSAQLRNMLDRLDDDRECLPELDARARLATDWRQAATAAAAHENKPVPGTARERECATGTAGWIAGTVQRGRIDGPAGSGDTRFSSPGLTLGWDAALAPGLRAGFAFGHGSERSRIGGSDATHMEAQAESISAYATGARRWACV
ncbi:autotransporter outer membrane beta-barrel domain-containing protein [Piscinibacter aquaticus]|uniref:Autotransporter outer membrane beta-barrel domain-containing protein n=1 Tax=Piscinibacter aquaticus TaxID=392597 RepID=A0A5C6TYU7_9BURK|nr:autotransporter outer membrane beta-barrel domain-containing protein [Piscinibacter aquaticus]